MKNIRVLYSYLFRYKYTSTTYYIFFLLFAVLENSGPYFYKLFIDTATRGEFALLGTLFLLYIGSRFLELILEQVARVLWDKMTFPAGRDARLDVFKKLHELDFAFHVNKSTGSLISASKRGDAAFYDMAEIINFDLLRIFISFLVAITLLFTIKIEIALVVLATIILNICASSFLIRHNIQKRRDWTESEDLVSDIITDNLINFDTVKLFAKENWELQKLKTAFKLWMSRLWAFAISFRLMEITSGVLGNLSIFLAVGIAAYMISTGQITPGEFILVVGYLTSLYPKLTQLMYRIRGLAKQFTDIEKYFGILEYKTSVKDPKKPVKLGSVKGEIVFDNVTFTYPENSKPVLENFNLKIRSGQSVAFVGRSGMGKTTLVKLIMRFFDIQKGQILLDGINIKKLIKSDLRSKIGIVPQEPILFNDTIAYNIGYGGENATEQQIIAAAKMSYLDDFIRSLPDQYQTKVGERGIKLSGGQKQRLAIARVILANPQIIIFDEATSHLDSESEKMIQEAFWHASKDKTTLIIAHRLATIVNADNIVVMHEGNIAESGSHRNLLQRKNGLYKHYWSIQTEVD